MMTKDEINVSLFDEVQRLRAENELLVGQLVACGVAALANTRKSALQQRDIADEYKSASWSDVCDAVDREMNLRDEVERLKTVIDKHNTKVYVS